MRLVDDEHLVPFRKLLDEYNQCFYERDIERLQNLYVADEDVIYFDNHQDCDSYNLTDHIQKVANFFKSGNIVPLSYEKLVVYQFGQSACMLVKFRYLDRPQAGIRTSFFLECHDTQWKIRHIHYSFDPNETAI